MFKYLGLKRNEPSFHILRCLATDVKDRVINKPKNRDGKKMYNGLTIKHINILKKLFAENDAVSLHENYKKNRDYIFVYWLAYVCFDALKAILVDRTVFDVTPTPYCVPSRTMQEYRSMLNSVVPSKRREAQANLDYFEFKQRMFDILATNKWIGGDRLRVIFFIPMPDGWEERKKKMMNNKPCATKPDYHSLLKGFLGATHRQDSPLSDVRIIKLWSYEGRIEVYDR